MKILGIEGMSPDRLQFEIQRGAKENGLLPVLRLNHLS